MKCKNCGMEIVKNKYSVKELKDTFIKGLGLKKTVFLGPIPKKSFNKEIPIEKMSVYRYMHYPHAKEMLVGKNRSLLFVSPEKWEDPMEKRFFHGKYKKAKLFKKKGLACLCVTSNASDNEAAAWAMYDKNRKNDLVRLTIDFGVLLKLLDDYVLDKDAKVYVAGVNYVPIAEIESPKTAKVDEFKHVDFLKLMLLKRKSFMFEGEIRIMIYGDDVSLDSEKFLKVPLNCNLKNLFLNIRISPDFVESKEKVLSEIDKKIKVDRSRLNAKAHCFVLSDR